MAVHLDILVFAAHPDDVELACGGSILKHVHAGLKVGIVDLTEGELGTRGTSEIRRKEATNAAALFGLRVRENLGIPDGFFQNIPEYQIKVVEKIRKFKPEVVLANAIQDRHPDHGKAANLIRESIFLAGLRKVETKDEQNNLQESWRPKHLYHYIQDRYIQPEIIIDVSNFWKKRMEIVMTFQSQFYDPNNSEPSTPISGKDFLDFLEARAREFGRCIGVEFGEGFIKGLPVGINLLTDLK